MANIKQIAEELASKIVYQLNQKDSNPNDNFIDTNIWKQYAVANYGAKSNANTKISVFCAKKYIETCLYTQSQATGKSISEIGNRWYSDLTEVKSKGEKQKISEPKTTVQNSKSAPESSSKSKIVDSMHKKWSSVFNTSKLGKDFYEKLYDVIKIINCSVSDTDFDRKSYSSKEEQTMDQVIAIFAGESQLNPQKSNGQYKGLFQLATPGLIDLKKWAKNHGNIPGMNRINQNASIYDFQKLSGNNQLDYLIAYVGFARGYSKIPQNETITPAQLWAMIKNPFQGKATSNMTSQKVQHINNVFAYNEIPRGKA